MKTKKGFTLIELIVSIVIVALLSVVAMVNFSGSRAKARDSRRVADLQRISMALEMARQLGTTYPANLNYLVGNSLIQNIPANPKGVGYSYSRLSGYTYGLWTSMEDLGSTNILPSNNKNYKVTNP